MKTNQTKTKAQIDSNVVVFQNPNPEVPHKTYTLAMSRKAHRYACLKTAQQVGEIDWKYTENDWTVLKASNNVEGTMYVTVRMAIPVTEYERRVREYQRLEKARASKNKALVTKALFAMYKSEHPKKEDKEINKFLSPEEYREEFRKEVQQAIKHKQAKKKGGK